MVTVLSDLLDWKARQQYVARMSTDSPGGAVEKAIDTGQQQNLERQEPDVRAGKSPVRADGGNEGKAELAEAQPEPGNAQAMGKEVETKAIATTSTSPMTASGSENPKEKVAKNLITEMNREREKEDERLAAEHREAVALVMGQDEQDEMNNLLEEQIDDHHVESESEYEDDNYDDNSKPAWKRNLNNKRDANEARQRKEKGKQGDLAWFSGINYFVVWDVKGVCCTTGNPNKIASRSAPNGFHWREMMMVACGRDARAHK
jgi:hypothetical protein